MLVSSSSMINVDSNVPEAEEVTDFLLGGGGCDAFDVNDVARHVCCCFELVDDKGYLEEQLGIVRSATGPDVKFRLLLL